jgi:hypothetical protein
VRIDKREKEANQGGQGTLREIVKYISFLPETLEIN